MVPEGTRCETVVSPREDYVGSDIPHRDGEGNVVMNAITTYDDGHTDCTVYASTATGSRKAW